MKRISGAMLRRLGRRGWLVVALAALAIVLTIVFTGPSDVEVATGAVLRGEFIVDVLTHGEIEAVNTTTVSAPRGRRSQSRQIVKLVPEGTEVRAGDFLFQLDLSSAQQAVESAQNTLETAQAELASARASIASNRAQLESQLKREEYDFERAELTRRMMQYEAEAKQREQELNLKIAEVNLNQAREKIAAQEVIDRATLMKAELKVTQTEAELQEAEQALAALTLTAPIDGLVVYKEIWSGSTMKKVQVGDSPWPGMAIVEIPDLSIMQAKATVNEVDISRIEADLNAIVTVDALGGAIYYGKVTRVAPLGRRESATNAKIFDVEVILDSTDVQLRPGMSCECRIITDRRADAIRVPLQCVFEQAGETIVYVATARGMRPRTVKVGTRSRDEIVILSGLEVDERVCLRDPTIPLEEFGEEDWNSPNGPRTAHSAQ